ncbi:hypothetical protein [Microbacterium hominis]|uniref:Uncharacterized protein n=1 Tax=Microbacterium hominis TaxID=162426 RepID=A0A0B4CFF1_9MICO|nr:hypothetical protein [Microbacterium hominis]KIC59979.1 hypothetical protein RM52_00750 [Microbacterium hominis]
MSEDQEPSVGRRLWRRFASWCWSSGPTADFLAVVAIVVAVVAILVPAISEVQAVDRDSAAAEDDASYRASDAAEQSRQGDTLHAIANGVNKLNESLGHLQSAEQLAEEPLCREGEEPFSGYWGPERPVFSDEALPIYPVLNSVRGNPNIGDERAFYGVRETDTPERVWSSTINVEDGHNYTLRVFVRNDASVVSAVATGATLTINLPNCVGSSIQTSALLASRDTFPLKIWSGVALNASQPFTVAYVEGSAVIESNAQASPVSVPGTGFLSAGGQLLGFDDLARPGYNWDLYFSFEVHIAFTN